MAISRHDPEWKRVIFMAMAGGATFQQTGGNYTGRGNTAHWIGKLPDGTTVSAGSKYSAALSLLYLMGADASILPDAAKPRTAPSGPDGSELRSS